MRLKFFYVLAFLFAINNFAQTTSCGNVVNDTFDVAGALPEGWTEYSTSGSVTVVNDYLKFNLAQNTPSAYRTFTPVSNNSSCSFDVQGSRTTMNFQMDLVSSDGKYIASIALGKATTDIKYATEMVNTIPGTYIAGVIGTAKFAKNKNYSLSLYVDFDNQTVDFYNDGVLTLENIPFLEATTNFAKVDAKLLYMYSNSGTAFLDNLTIVEANESRIALSNAIDSSQNTINAAIVGDKYSQYPQSAVDNFQLAIDNANVVLANCDATSSVMDAAISDLQTAQNIFATTSVNDPVLKMYSGYDFTGDVNEVYCGYYNGGLGAYEDWGVSFTLEKGYMATFAQDVNGLGFSKIYIAQDDDLEINLPVDLQSSISFIRVSPWYPVGKKGSLGGDIKWSSADNYNTTWHYSWGLTDQKSEGVQFVPMSWSKGDNWTSIENMEKVGQNMSFNHLLAFNEPDNKDQSNLTVEQALDAYPKLLASGLRLGAPGVENVQYSATSDSFNESSWIKEFMDGCVERGYRVDFIPAHDYVRRSKSTFLERFKALHDRYDLPVWVTEYNYGNPNMGSAPLTVEQGYNNIKGLTEVLENADFIERYNWYYFFGADSGIGGITDGELNITGQFYRDLDSQNPSYIQEEYEQGAQLSVNDALIKSKVLMFPTVITEGVFNLRYSEEIKDSTIHIYSTVGQLVKKIVGLKSEIDVRTLSSGLYIVKIESHLGNFTKKIIIQ
ncbi:Por secretion system C-terminal sorting domain-containing protein [Polaribacter sp. KT25b]|uniref:glycosyl hydrolase n=1 Tax=Polaribacter sp. KT25b TaxID=1855336 RepID=UPI00087A9D15|nr:glycosyl hydrolase [Polaribacter sp. KT25b]SDS58796.1 Por secretion system C-terminal sorting domain-containing protein [Polaribacter sp. KT25b]